MGKRLVILPWSCDMSGDCCKSVGDVVMTKEEAGLLKGAVDPAQWATLLWKPVEDGFVALMAAPCPLLGADNRCTVHAVRPYNCRRFACLRVEGEAFEPEPLDLARGRFGCANLSDRVRDSRDARRFYAKIQRKAQRWAMSHGWTNE